MNGLNELSQIPPWVWVILAIILMAQGLWVFNDAGKRGMNKWLWGFLCLLNTPSNLIVYLIVSRSKLGTDICKACGNKINKIFSYCPHCGNKNDWANERGNRKESSDHS